MAAAAAAVLEAILSPAGGCNGPGLGATVPLGFIFREITPRRAPSIAKQLPCHLSVIESPEIRCDGSHRISLSYGEPSGGLCLFTVGCNARATPDSNRSPPNPRSPRATPDSGWASTSSGRCPARVPRASPGDGKRPPEGCSIKEKPSPPLFCIPHQLRAL